LTCRTEPRYHRCPIRPVDLRHKGHEIKKKSDDVTLDRRGFLKGAASGAGAILITVPGADARAHAAPKSLAASGNASPPTLAQLARDAGNARPPVVSGPVVRKPGSDLMVDTLKELGIEYVASNPGSSFEGLQESLVNYGDPPNTMPEFITALHEESSVDMAHGYGKAEGRPMCALLHGTLGIQHASMAIYQAYFSQTPILLIAGRDDHFIQPHTANDMAAMVRSFTKWDAQPASLLECVGALREAYNQAITPPTGPTLVMLDTEFQKQEAAGLAVPKYRPAHIPAIDTTTARDIAKSLVTASNPHLAVGRLRTPEGVRLAVELAELLGASTSTYATFGPMSFPQRHPLCGPGANSDYDFTLGLEAGPANVGLVAAGINTQFETRDDMGVRFGGLRPARPGDAHLAVPPDPGLVSRYAAGADVERRIDVDAEASLPRIIDEVEHMLSPGQRRAAGERRKQHAAANLQAHVQAVRLAVDDKRIGWDASPVSTARIYAELWPLIKDEDWCLASPSSFSGAHHRDLWDHNKPYSYLGGQGAAGIGYGLGASTGAALAAKQRGRIVINIQCDGDINYAPGALWTAAHHQLPMLTVMHNNRAWHQELMFLEFMAGSRGRGTDRAHIGSTLRDPFIDYRKMADAYGMASEGPISDPSLLAAALERGVASVKQGHPYLIDVLTQPR
jgi:thiamine pyrophosphate-dependent acetolactate synthase large subunit-like protein